MTKKKLKPIPNFKSLQEEADFWDTHDFTDYVDFSKPTKVIYPKNLTEGVTIRFSLEDLNFLRKIAHQKGLGVTTFIRLHMLDILNKTRHSHQL
jgi:predicted DNA binding CopG/RHH family protein